jgi:hypothetical protein
MIIRRSIPLRVLWIGVVSAALLAAAACGDDREAEAPAEAEAVSPGPILGVSQTGWGGVEARLVRSQRVQNMLSVEVQLVNVGQSPVPIKDYSAADAKLTDNATQRSFGVFEQPGNKIASDDVDAELDPGESVIVTAVFPLPRDAADVTIAFPNVQPFTVTVPGGVAEKPTTPRDLRNGQTAAEGGGKASDKGPATNR